MGHSKDGEAKEPSLKTMGRKAKVESATQSLDIETGDPPTRN